MLLASQTINKLFAPNDPRLSNRFPVINAGPTIRDRLRVLDPADHSNHYREVDRVCMVTMAFPLFMETWHRAREMDDSSRRLSSIQNALI
jgi:hypothetical protein